MRSTASPSEKIGLDLIGQQLGPRLLRNLGDDFLKGKYGSAAKALLEAELITDVQGAEEFLAEFGQNAIAGKGIPFVVEGFDPDRSLLENAHEAYWKGKATGALLLGPAVASPKQLAERAVTPVAEQQIRQDVQKAPVAPVAAPAGPPSVLPPPQPVEVEPDIQQALAPLDAQQLSTLEEAALDILFDENAAVAAQQRAAQIIEQIDQTRPTTTEELQAPTAQEKAKFIEDLGIAARRSTEPTVTERQALRASLRAQKRVAEIVARTVRAEVQATAKAKENIGKDTRNKVRRIVRAVIAPGRQGRFLRLVENATPARLGRVLDEVELGIEQDRVAELSSEVKALTKRVKKQRNISEATRAEALEGLTAASELINQDFSRLKGIPAKLGAMRSAIGFVQETGDNVALDVATEAGQARVNFKGRVRQTKTLAKEVVANINATTGDP
ncbi:MAG: hypothetical protein ACYSVY_27050 [Planctomycetota bacterium]|jgi:hypothetical protein